MRKPLIYVAGMLLLFSLCFVLPANAFGVTSPNGGEIWAQGSSHPITWYHHWYEMQNAQINLYERSCGRLPSGIPFCIDVFRKTIAPSVSITANSYTWSIPTDQAPGTYSIEIKYLDGSKYDRSDGYFTISGLRLTSPNGGENWVRGSPHRITWYQAGLTGTNVKLDLLTYGLIGLPGLSPSRSPITSYVSAERGYYDWTPPVRPPGNYLMHTYRVEVRSLSNSQLSDTSDKSFDLTNPSAATITVTSPACGVAWQPGTQHAVTWTFTGDPGPNVKVVLLRGGIEVGTAVSSTPTAAGSYLWSISSGRAPGTDYQILVQSTSNPSVKGTSCMFTIGQPSTTPTIKVTSPNSAVVWKRGTTHPVTWTYTGDPGPNVKIELLQAGTPVGTATYSTPTATGSYPWAISSGRAPGTNYRIRVTSVSKPTVTDTSDVDFTITA